MQGIIGRNIRLYRDQMGMSQDQLAAFLQANRVTVSYYETGEREVPLDTLNKMVDLFGVDLADLLEEDASNVTAHAAFAFRANELEPSALESIAHFRKIVRNYLKISALHQTL